jgi:hypothetical protein
VPILVLGWVLADLYGQSIAGMGKILHGAGHVQLPIYMFVKN